MNNISMASDNTILQKIGERLARYRLNKNMTQNEMADEAGVSRATIARLESGNSTQLSNFIRILRALDLLQNMDVVVPEPQISPMQQLKMAGKIRKRARKSAQDIKNTKGVEEEADVWQWGDDN